MAEGDSMPKEGYGNESGVGNAGYCTGDRVRMKEKSNRCCLINHLRCLYSEPSPQISGYVRTE